MLVYGTANPEGLEDYQGIYLNTSDVDSMVEQVDAAAAAGRRIPVHVEHKGVAVGEVISAWNRGGRLECVLQLNPRVFEGSISAEMVRRGMCKDLSLGYSVALENTKQGGVKVGSKKLHEISIVMEGLRPHCHIRGFVQQPPQPQGRGGAAP